MAYKDDLITVNATPPTHYWPLGSDGLVDLGSSPTNLPVTLYGGASNSGVSINAASNSLRVLSTAGSASHAGVANSTDTNNGLGIYSSRTFCGWFSCDDLSRPSCIWKEGGYTNNFAVVAGIARNVSIQAAAFGSFFLIKFADNLIKESIPYFFAFTWERASVTSGAGTRVRFWINGVEQGASVVVSDPSTSAFPSHTGNLIFGQAVNGMGDTVSGDLKFYNETKMSMLPGAKNLKDIAIWNDVLLSSTEIKSLFTLGAAATTSNLTISNLVPNTAFAIYEVDGSGFILNTLVSPVLSATLSETNAYPVTTETLSVVRIRKYEYVAIDRISTLTRFDSEAKFFQVIDTITLLTEVAASTIAGINIDGALKTISVTSSLTINDIYDYQKWWSSQTANHIYDLPVTSIDGVSFALNSGWKLILNAQVLGGINLVGDVELSALATLSDHNIRGTLTFTAAGTYYFTNCNINNVVNNSGGSVIINSNNTIITTNTGPNITINNSKQFSFTINKALTAYEWRIYQVTALGSLAGAVELAGQEIATTQTNNYSYNYSVDISVAVQIIGHANKIVESTTYYTLTNKNQSVNIILQDDTNV